MKKSEAKRKKREVSVGEIDQTSRKRILKGLPVGGDPAMGLIGLGNSKKRDISDKHDRYLANYEIKRKR